MSDSKKKAAGGKPEAKKGEGGGEGRVQAVAAKPGKAAASPAEKPRLASYYTDIVRAELIKEFGYKNPMEVPKLEKIVINMGVGEAAGDQKKLDAAVADLTAIAGQ